MSGRNTLDADDLEDAIRPLCESVNRISGAITDAVMPGTDATDGTVGCLTEAVMGVTAGLVRIADAIADLAQAVREAKEQ